MQNVQTETAPRFVSLETETAFLEGMVTACGKHAKADRNLCANLLGSARLIGRPVDDAAWDEHFRAPARKALAKKVSPDDVRTYLKLNKLIVRAVTARPPVSDALPLGKHWADQRTGRKPEGVNAYYKRVAELLKVATPNEAGVLILPEGYDMLGNAPKAATPEAATPSPAAPAGDAQGSAGEAAKVEGGINVDPAKAKADARASAANTLMGNAKAGAALLALLETNAGRLALAELMANPPKEEPAKVRKAA